MRDTKIIALIILVIALVSILFSISHYGLHFLPQSSREFYHDICTIIFIVAYFIADDHDKSRRK